jgi:uncharacterized protein YndB with AHSA1/START domain
MKNKITIHATIHANIEKAWEMYTDPKHIVNWNFASDDWMCPSASNNLEVGGKYIARMEAKDGSFGFDFEATYDAVELHKYIKYTMPDAEAREVEIHFKSNDNNTTDVELTFDAENENPLDMQRDGWQAILNNYKSYVEKN